MQKQRMLVSVLALTLALFSASVASAGPKTTLCHFPPDNPTNWSTIAVDNKSLASHLAHGDKLGSCATNCSTLCTDGNVCTDDVQSTSGGGCVCYASPHPANTVSCSDGNTCTTNDTCSNRVCVGGPALSCDDHDACTSDGSCNSQTGCPAKTPVAIDDNDACTADTCDSSTGVSHTPVAINDNDACTTDACDSITGVSHTPVAIDDNNVCTTDA